MGSDIQKPSIIFLGVHHSGSSVIAAMLHRLGWIYTETDKDYIKRQSYRWVVDINREIIKGQRGLKAVNMEKIQAQIETGLEQQQKPFVFKDPRFCLTLEHWRGPILRICKNAVLVYVTRNTERLKKSFKKRHQKTGGVPGESGHSVEAWVKHSRRQYDLWIGPKFELDYNDIHHAFQIWDGSRKTTKNVKFGRIGF